MKILQVHSEYSRPGGEEVAVAADATMLRAHGHAVLTLARAARNSNALEMAGEMLGLPLSLGKSLPPDEAVKFVLALFKPDVIHLHNWHRWGPRGLRALGASGVPLVATAHNYRHWCPAGTAYRAGAPCTLCMGRSFPAPAVEFGCWHKRHGSAIAAIGAWQMDWSVVDHWIAVSSFVREGLIEAGIATDQNVTVRHGSVADSGPPGEGEGGFVLAVCPSARPEKGLALLLEAWRSRPRSEKLLVIGASGLDLGDDSVASLPAMPRADLMRMMGYAAFVIVPSVWFDPCPTVAIEALSRKTPVLATLMGGLPELIDPSCGWGVAPTAADLSAGIDLAFAEAAGKRSGARAAYLERFTPERSYAPLMAAYDRARAQKLVARGAEMQPAAVGL